MNLEPVKNKVGDNIVRKKEADIQGVDNAKLASGDIYFEGPHKAPISLIIR